jgi:acetyl-CoA carboxylase biotin carboxyl carrier protein
MDLRKLKTLIDLVQNSGISELEISEGEEKIRIAKHFAAAPATTVVSMPVATTSTAPGAALVPAPQLVDDTPPRHRATS